MAACGMMAACFVSGAHFSLRTKFLVEIVSLLGHGLGAACNAAQPAAPVSPLLDLLGLVLPCLRGIVTTSTSTPRHIVTSQFVTGYIVTQHSRA